LGSILAKELDFEEKNPLDDGEIKEYLKNSPFKVSPTHMPLLFSSSSSGTQVISFVLCVFLA